MLHSFTSAYQHEQLVVCDIDGGPTEAFQEVHRGHGWSFDGSSSDHHVQKGSDAALQTETRKGQRSE